MWDRVLLTLVRTCCSALVVPGFCHPMIENWAAVPSHKTKTCLLKALGRKPSEEPFRYLKLLFFQLKNSQSFSAQTDRVNLFSIWHAFRTLACVACAFRRGSEKLTVPNIQNCSFIYGNSRTVKIHMTIDLNISVSQCKERYSTKDRISQLQIKQ